MILTLVTLLMGAPSGSQANPIAMWLPIIIIFALVYFFILRPRAKYKKTSETGLSQVRELQRDDEQIKAIDGAYLVIPFNRQNQKRLS